MNYMKNPSIFMEAYRRHVAAAPKKLRRRLTQKEAGADECLAPAMSFPKPTIREAWTRSCSIRICCSEGHGHRGRCTRRRPRAPQDNAHLLHSLACYATRRERHNEQQSRTGPSRKKRFPCELIYRPRWKS
jgi:hypothetical protein